MSRHLADRINENAAPEDRVSDRALNERVRRHEQDINTNRVNKPQPESGLDAGNVHYVVDGPGLPFLP